MCRLHYLDGRSRIEIADHLGISRFKVARLIEGAMAQGIVQITIVDPDGHEDDLAHRLRRRYRLDHAIVVPSGTNDAATTAEVGSEAARFVAASLPSGATLGLGWGRSVGAVVDALERSGNPGPVDVVQLAGGFAGSDDDFNGPELTLRAAKALHGQASLLHAPALLESLQARDALLREPAVARTVRRYADLDLIVAGIGALRPHPTSTIYRGTVLGGESLAELVDSGAVGDASCHFIDAEGRLVPGFPDRSSGIGPEHVRRVPIRLAVAHGRAKLLAVHAALRSGLVNAVATDDDTAGAVLAAYPA